jgi:hypothetical protein
MQDEQAAPPEPNAPGPEVLRDEIINIVVGAPPGRIHRHAAGNITDAILQRLMRYYAEMATPELVADSTEQMQVVMDCMGLMNALIQQGAQFTQYMNDEQLRQWRSVAARSQHTIRRMAEMFS